MTDASRQLKYLRTIFMNVSYERLPPLNEIGLPMNASMNEWPNNLSTGDAFWMDEPQY